MRAVVGDVASRSRRRFMGLALAGGGTTLLGLSRMPSALSDPLDDCGCENMLPILSACRFRGGLVCLAFDLASDAIGLYELEEQVGSAAVTLGRELLVDWPETFIPTALTVSNDRLILAGGQTSVLAEISMYFEHDAAFAALDVVPSRLPPLGYSTVQELGVAPAFARLDGQRVALRTVAAAEPSSFAIAVDVAATRDGLVMLVTGNESPSADAWFASSVDVVRVVEGGQSVRRIASGLGEGGPHMFGYSPQVELVIATDQAGSTSAFASNAGWRSQPDLLPSGSLAVSGGPEITTLSRTSAGVEARRLSGTGQSAPSRLPIPPLPEGEVRAVAVNGASGEFLLFQPTGAQLVTA